MFEIPVDSSIINQRRYVWLKHHISKYPNNIEKVFNFDLNNIENKRSLLLSNSNTTYSKVDFDVSNTKLVHSNIDNLYIFIMNNQLDILDTLIPNIKDIVSEDNYILYAILKVLSLSDNIISFKIESIFIKDDFLEYVSSTYHDEFQKEFVYPYEYSYVGMDKCNPISIKCEIDSERTGCELFITKSENTISHIAYEISVQTKPNEWNIVAIDTRETFRLFYTDNTGLFRIRIKTTDMMGFDSSYIISDNMAIEPTYSNNIRSINMTFSKIPNTIIQNKEFIVEWKSDLPDDEFILYMSKIDDMEADDIKWEEVYRGKDQKYVGICNDTVDHVTSFKLKHADSEISIESYYIRFIKYRSPKIINPRGYIKNDNAHILFDVFSGNDDIPSELIVKADNEDVESMKLESDNMFPISIIIPNSIINDIYLDIESHHLEIIVKNSIETIKYETKFSVSDMDNVDDYTTETDSNIMPRSFHQTHDEDDDRMLQVFSIASGIKFFKLHMKTEDDEYINVRFESDSRICNRPNGNTVEKSLNNIELDITSINSILPEISSASRPSQSTPVGKIIITNSKVFVKTRDGVVREFQMTPTFVRQSTAPSDTNLLWFDNSRGANLLKFYSGGTWNSVHSIYK